MRCPFCGNEDTQVKDSRSAEDNVSIRRRRFCLKCNARFTTYERMVVRDLLVVKKNGEVKAFDRDKIARSVNIATRKRAIPKEEIESLVDRVHKKLEALGESEIASSIIGELVMEELAKLDQVAYVRFASVYRDFCEPKDFLQFVDSLKIKSKVSS